MLSAYFIHLSALHCRIIIICVVELDLDELNFRLFSEDHIQRLGCIMERDPEVPYQSFLLESECSLIGVASFEFVIVTHALSMHQVEVEVFNTAQLKLLTEERLDIIFAVEERFSQFVGKKKAVSRMAF